MIKKECDRLNLETREWLEKRNSIQEQIKGLRVEAGDLRKKRDSLNDRVRELKNLREQAKVQRKEIRSQILRVKEKIGTFMKKRPPSDMRDIQRQIEKLDWKIQTTPLTLEEEKPLLGQVKLLGAQLTIYKKIQELNQNLVKLKAEKEALETKAKHYHKELSELAEQSQKFHERMLEVLMKVHALQEEADKAHQKYIEAEQQSQGLDQKYAVITHQIWSLKQPLHEAEKERQAKHQIELYKELKEKALKKLKRGEKLSWEEFKVLAEQGIV